MSRSGYVEDDDYDEDGSQACWRGAVASALRGHRGQMFLRAMLKSLDALPAPKLIKEALVTPEGDCCAMGAVALHCGIEVADLDPEDPEAVAKRFGIAGAMAAEIAYENDERSGWRAEETPEQRFTRMRTWVVANIIEPRHVEVVEPVGGGS